MKVGNMSFSAPIKNCIACCFDKDVLKLFSYRGKTKKTFTGLNLFEVIYGIFFQLFFNVVLQKIIFIK